MAGKYLLGVDVGTTSVKVAVIDENAGVLGISKSSYNLITPEPPCFGLNAICRRFMKKRNISAMSIR